MAVHAEPLPVAMPGLRALRWTTDQLYSGLKEIYAVARVERGRTEWWGRGKVWRSEPGSIQIKQPGDVHRDLANDGVVTFQILSLPRDEVERVHHKLVVRPQIERGDARGAPFHRLFDAIERGADRLSLEVAVVEAIAALGELSDGTPEHTRPVKRAIELLRERLDEPITLAELASHAGLDKFHLCRAFRAQIGIPPHAYLTRLRIVRAKDLLDAGLRPGEVALRVGLYDQSQLNRHFRRLVGTTPGRYARQRRSDPSSPQVLG